MTRFIMLAAAVMGALLCLVGFATAQVMDSQPADRLTCGDRQIDFAIASVELTAEQTDKLKPIFESFAKEIKAAKDAFDQKAKPTGDKLKEMYDAAKKNGTTAALQNQDDWKALRAELGKMQEEEAKAADERHERMTTELFKMLTPSQKRRFMMRSGMSSKDPKRVLQSRAATVIEHWAAGIELTDQQYDEIMNKIQEMIVKHEAAVAEAHETDSAKINDWWQALHKNMKEVIEGFLTDDQKKQAAANRLERYQKTTASITDMAAKSINRLDPTAEQKDKAAALAADAREAMLKLDPEDRLAWGKIYRQLQDDVNKLLTEEQRTKRDTPIEFGTTQPAAK